MAANVTTTSTFDLGKYCEHCGNYHTGTCPRIKAIEYHKNGKIKRVEYHDMSAVSVPLVQSKPWRVPPHEIACGSTSVTVNDDTAYTVIYSLMEKYDEAWTRLAEHDVRPGVETVINSVFDERPQLWQRLADA